MTGNHRQEGRRAHWAKVPGVLLQGFAAVGALLIVVVGLWAFDRPTGPTQEQEFLHAIGVLLAALVGLGGLYLVQVLAAYVRQRAGLETGPISEDGRMIALVGADLRGANLRMDDLSGANLSGADLGTADLSRANLSEANLSEANLRAAILLRTNLRGANLSGADLRRVAMSNAALMGADLRGANLGMANLSGADLRQADLSRANLSGAYGWTEAHFRAVGSLEGATMPCGHNYEDWPKVKESRWEDVENPGPPR